MIKLFLAVVLLVSHQPDAVGALSPGAPVKAAQGAGAAGSVPALGSSALPSLVPVQTASSPLLPTLLPALAAPNPLPAPDLPVAGMAEAVPPTAPQIVAEIARISEALAPQIEAIQNSKTSQEGGSEAGRAIELGLTGGKDIAAANAPAEAVRAPKEFPELTEFLQIALYYASTKAGETGKKVYFAQASMSRPRFQGASWQITFYLVDPQVKPATKGQRLKHDVLYVNFYDKTDSQEWLRPAIGSEGHAEIADEYRMPGSYKRKYRVTEDYWQNIEMPLAHLPFPIDYANFGLFKRGLTVAPEAAWETARRLAPELGPRLSLYYEFVREPDYPSERQGTDPWYHFQDEKGHVVAVNGNSGNDSSVGARVLARPPEAPKKKPASWLGRLLPWSR